MKRSRQEKLLFFTYVMALRMNEHDWKRSVIRTGGSRNLHVVLVLLVMCMLLGETGQLDCLLCACVLLPSGFEFDTKFGNAFT
jgi:hypothetical protein